MKDVQINDTVEVTEYHDNETYITTCLDVLFEDGQWVFYGTDGTRCLLCDVAKISSK